jgi:excisionase family DNA binding protein
MDRLLMSIPQVCDQLALGRSKVYELIAAGEIRPVIRIGRAVRIPASAISAYVERLQEEAEEEGT